MLDCDHRLICERLEERNLMFGEGLDDSSGQGDGAQRPAIAYQWDRPHRSVKTNQLLQLRILACIGDLHDGVAEDCPARYAVTPWRLRECPRGGFDLFRCTTVLSHEVDEVPIEAEEGGVVCFAQGRRGRRDRLEGRLNSRR